LSCKQPAIQIVGFTLLFPSLVLAQMPFWREDEKRYEPSYAVIEWNDDLAGRKQAVFEFREVRLGSLKALQMAPDRLLRRVGF
jgi:hypothetical protein